MRWKKVAIPISVVIVIVVVAGLVGTDSDRVGNAILHVTLASPDLYNNGIFSEEIILDAGEYIFEFVPNGDSPRILSISIRGETFDFSEDFELVGTLHETGISQYYTWDYRGQKTIMIPNQEQVVVEINPNGNIMGPVSVGIFIKLEA